MKMALLPLLLLGSACTTAVYHPDKNKAEMQADIQACEREANRLHYWDRMAALKFAYDCMKAKGYSLEEPAIVEEVKGKGQAPRRNREPGQPCRVPC